MTNPLKASALFAAVMCATATPVFAQAPAAEKKWQIEVFGGVSKTSGGKDGTPFGQFPAGTPIATGGGTTTTRAVSSWYFGDGTFLFNQANAALGGSGRIGSLDTLLNSGVAEREGSPAFGVRLTRVLTPRLALEFSAGYSKSSLHMSDETASDIEAISASFITGWNSLLATGATTNRTVTSTADIERGDGHEITLGGALKLRLPGTAKLSPYVTAGGGAVFNGGTLPSATLTGNYSFLFSGLFPVTEKDVVTVTVQNEERGLFGMAGGGVEYNLSANRGIRADVRLQLGGNKVDTLLSASPSVTTQLPAFAVSTGTIPSVQFSNSPTLGRQSSLSGPAIADLRTFEGSGSRIVTSLSVGYFVRF